MPGFKDITGQRFGRLIVLFHHSKRKNRQLWLCRCDCETELLVLGDNLNSNNTQSCGCSRILHGHANRPGRYATGTYRSWGAMIQRCTNPKAYGYQHWGGRGITVCDRWRTSFENFFADMGPRPPGYAIERINNDGNYEPGNCIWIPKADQPKNQRRPTIIKRHLPHHQ